MPKSDIPATAKNRYLEYLGRNGLKSTVQRDIIIGEFFKTRGHVSVEQLHTALRGIHSSIGLATVYRTLKILADAGLAHERRFNDGFTRYECCAPDDNHHDHIVCLSCGLVQEFENDEIEELQRNVAANHNFRMLKHKLEIYGLCEACDEKKK